MVIAVDMIRPVEVRSVHRSFVVTRFDGSRIDIAELSNRMPWGRVTCERRLTGCDLRWLDGTIASRR